MMLKCPKCGEEIFDWSEQEKVATEDVAVGLARELLRITEPGASSVTDQDMSDLRRRAHGIVTELKRD